MKFSSTLRFSLLLLTFAFANLLLAQNEPPQIDNLQISVDENTRSLQVSYDLSDDNSTTLGITLQISTDNQLSYQAVTDGLSGDVGNNVSPGTAKQLSWQYDNFFTTNGQYHLRLTADDLTVIDIADLVSQVDSNRLRQDLEAIVGVRHASAGRDLLEATKDTIRNRFNAFGLELREQSWSRGSYDPHNIIGQQYGMVSPQEQYIVDAHFDTVDDSPGADDNGSGVVGMLEVARILSQYSTEKTVEFIGFDLEEVGLTGSLRFVNNSGGRIRSNTILGVLNLEMIGYYTNAVNSQQLPNRFELVYPTVYNEIQADSFRGNFITNVGDNQSSSLMNAFSAASQQYVPDLKEYAISANVAGTYLPDLTRSDHYSFWSRNIPALMLTDGSNFRNPYYHSPDDTVDKLNFTFMRHVVQATLATVATLAGVRSASAKTGAFELMDVLNSTHTAPDCAISLAPQPSDQNLLVQLTDCPASWQQVRLLDSRGQTVYAQQTDERTTSIRVDTQTLPSGIYFLILSDGEQKLIKKVSVMH